MSELKVIPDHRCSGLPDTPYSSFCQVCWFPVYSLWIDRDPHNGVCINGCTDATKCSEAINRARSSAAMTKMRAAMAKRKSTEESK